MITSRDPQAGFTLIETLVALSVLAIGSMTLLVGVERHATATRGLEDRVVARWVAENVLAATLLDVDVAPEWSIALGVDWAARVETRPLSGSGLSAVTVRVGDAAEGQDASVVALTGYQPTRGDTK